MRYLLVAMLLMLAVPVQAADGDPVPAEISRTSGVAPLGVMMHADLVSGSTNMSFHSYRFKLNFGDGTVVWEPIAGHVYTTAGTYTATITVYDPANSMAVVSALSESWTVTVSDPDVIYATTATTCVSTSGDFAGCPENANQVTTSTVSTLTGYVDAGERLLFKRGESWSISAAISWPSNHGPVTIGAYGSCTDTNSDGICENAPTITQSSTSPVFSFTGRWDWRVMDLKLIGPGNGTGNALSASTAPQHNLIYRNWITSSWDYGINFTTITRTGDYDSERSRYNVIAENYIENQENIGIYIGSEHLSLLNNVLTGAGQHTVRIWKGYIVSITGNTWSGNGYDLSGPTAYGGHVLKYHGPMEYVDGTTAHEVGDYATSGAYGDDHRSRWAVVHDNFFGSTSSELFAVQPQNTSRAERIYDVIVERNRLISGYGYNSGTTNPGQYGYLLKGSYFTVRNNIAKMDAATIGARTIVFSSLVSGPAWIYNNTVYRYNTPSGYLTYAVQLSACANSIVRNNLLVVPAGSGTKTALSNAGTSTTSSNNIVSTAEILADVDTYDFNLVQGASAAIDQGYSLSQVWDDFRGFTRVGLTNDIGAYEFESPGQLIYGNVLQSAGIGSVLQSVGTGSVLQ